MCQEIRNYISNKVKYFRTQKGLTREQLSLMLNLDNSYISKLEKGNINITIDQLGKMINIFEITIEEFFN